jgi:ribosomal protein S24E
MVHRILVVTAALFVLSQSSCHSKSSSDREAGRVRSEPVGTEVSFTAEAVPKDNRARKSTFASGTLMVFGIKIPTGMSPATGPEKVYRFEGRLPLERTVMLVRNQIVAEREEKENQGILFRFAESKRLNTRTKDKDGVRALAIRVFPTPKGSTLDIWLEKEYSERLPNIHSTTTSLPVPQLPKTHQFVVKKADREKERQSRSTAVRALQKMERGEKLTPEEAASGVMD